jgi:hypothetical protein
MTTTRPVLAPYADDGLWLSVAAAARRLGATAAEAARYALACDAAAVHAILTDPVAEAGIERTWSETAQPVPATVVSRRTETGTGIVIAVLAAVVEG